MTKRPYDNIFFIVAGSIKQMVSLIGIFPSSVQDFQRFHPDEIASKILTPDLRACIVSHDDTFF
ncbi:MAG: hypothetical protein KGI50_03910, partial [Patescibacteria group bacterium]|nr:hypothetical protein [Patescibacteria group bacterium]